MKQKIAKSHQCSNRVPFILCILFCSELRALDSLDLSYCKNILCSKPFRFLYWQVVLSPETSFIVIHSVFFLSTVFSWRFLDCCDYASLMGDSVCLSFDCYHWLLGRCSYSHNTTATTPVGELRSMLNTMITALVYGIHVAYCEVLVLNIHYTRVFMYAFSCTGLSLLVGWVWKFKYNVHMISFLLPTTTSSKCIIIWKWTHFIFTWISEVWVSVRSDPGVNLHLVQAMESCAWIYHQYNFKKIA